MFLTNNLTNNFLKKNQKPVPNSCFRLLDIIYFRHMSHARLIIFIISSWVHYDLVLFLQNYYSTLYNMCHLYNIIGNIVRRRCCYVGFCCRYRDIIQRVRILWIPDRVYLRPLLWATSQSISTGLWLFNVAWISILLNLFFRASASPSITPSSTAATSSGSTAGTTPSNAAATSSGSTAGPGEYLQVCEFCDCVLLLDSPFS